MAQINWKHSNLIHLFYNNGEEWKTLGYGQSHGISRSAETQTVSSKDNGIWPDTLVSGNSWSMSGEYLFTVENANVIMGMADAAKPFTICMALVAETDWASGIQPVTDKTVNPKWTIGTWKKYGNALVTSVDLSAQMGDVATLSVEFTGSGSLQDTVPTTINAYPGE